MQLVLEADQEIQLQLAEMKTAATAQPTTPARTKANPITRATTNRERSIFGVNYIESLEWT